MSHKEDANQTNRMVDGWLRFPISISQLQFFTGPSKETKCSRLHVIIAQAPLRTCFAGTALVQTRKVPRRVTKTSFCLLLYKPTLSDSRCLDSHPYHNCRTYHCPSCHHSTANYESTQIQEWLESFAPSSIVLNVHAWTSRAHIWAGSAVAYRSLYGVVVQIVADESIALQPHITQRDKEPCKICNITVSHAILKAADR